MAKGDQTDEDKLDEILKTMKTDFMVSKNLYSSARQIFDDACKWF